MSIPPVFTRKYTVFPARTKGQIQETSPLPPFFQMAKHTFLCIISTILAGSPPFEKVCGSTYGPQWTKQLKDSGS